MTETNETTDGAARPRLTARQRRILDVIEDAIREHGYPPSMREIASKAGLASPSSVLHQLCLLYTSDAADDIALV